MDKYIINKKKQGSKSGKDYEVHNIDKKCEHLPNPENMIPLGLYKNCVLALNYAKRKWSRNAHEIDGCFYCTSCHKK